ncbi:alpha/beta hydrolase [Acidipila sp. EB88]|uniref:alpha/beta hydrolase n=1 Tax=Acidipila sp. EB88 TaxID=2305226 RepID=UPI001F170E04|nr:alpha/beta hydrolase [Acidipila sp. EB88]
MALGVLATFALCLLAGTAAVAQQPVLLLWPGGAPGSEGKTSVENVRLSPEGDHVVSGVHQPSITAFLPTRAAATGAGVLVIPGGGHSEIWIDHEGRNVAEWLSERGIAAFVLKYRLAREPGSTYTIDGTELEDTRRAIRLIRSHAASWGIDTQRVGVIGFSAGGELAALISTRPVVADVGSVDPVDRENALPAFQGLIYPGIAREPTLSLSAHTPPAFLACGADDRADISERLPALYLQLKQVGVPVELHIFAKTGHGFGLRSTTVGNAALWPSLFLGWLSTEGFLKPLP